MLRRERVEIKTPDQVRLMRRAGLVVADALDAVRDAVAPGVTTGDLDAVAARVIAAAGATPSFLGYEGFPATVCVSVNDEVVHGIPGGRVLAPGDVVSIDCGAILAGWHGDAAVSVQVAGGDPDEAAADAALVETTRAAMWAGIAALAAPPRTGLRTGVVGLAVEDVVAAAERPQVAGDVGVVGDYGIVEGYVGHGIGTAMHQAPDVPNFRVRRGARAGSRVRPGLCVAIEPMLTRGGAATRELEDGWTVVTADGSRAAHWEHTVAVGSRGVWVLTARDGGAAELAARGLLVAPLT